MAFRKLSAALFAAAMMLAGCSAAPAEKTEETVEIEPAKVLVPSGAPALAMTLGTKDMEGTELEYTNGTDLLTAELSKADGDYDVIVAPVNLGIKLHEGNPAYKLAAILSWGNLYMAGTGEDVLSDESATVALFGDGAVPGLVYNAVEAEDVKAQTEWMPSVAEANQALLSGKAQGALLAEPALTAALAKNTDLKVIADLQQVWQDKEGSERKGYPQAAVFVKEDVQDSWLDALKSGLDGIDPADEDGTLAKLIEEIGADKIGVPNAQVALKSWDRQNIEYVPAADCLTDVETFLTKFNMTVPADAVRK